MEEPWLRGPIPGVHPMVAPLLMSFQMAREDLAHVIDGLSDQQIWQTVEGIPSLGFHLRHIAGSVDRLSTYLQGRLLSEDQLAFLRAESQPRAAGSELLAGIEAAFSASEDAVRGLDQSVLSDSRSVGRKALPTTVIGLIVHIAEHTQRHVGQAITTANLLRHLPQQPASAEGEASSRTETKN